MAKLLVLYNSTRLEFISTLAILAFTSGENETKQKTQATKEFIMLSTCPCKYYTAIPNNRMEQ
jgi:hypothetical protein